jgi:dephospho-CoA kinase
MSQTHQLSKRCIINLIFTNTDQIVNTFGPSIVDTDGKINRRQLGAKVFSDKNEMKRLTDIVWPAISDKAKQVKIS